MFATNHSFFELNFQARIRAIKDGLKRWFVDHLQLAECFHEVGVMIVNYSHQSPSIDSF